MRPIRTSTLKTLLLSGVGEAAAYQMLGSTLTGALMTTGLPVVAAIPAAIVIYNIASNVAIKNAQTLVNASVIGLARGAGSLTQMGQSGLRAIRMMIAPDNMSAAIKPNTANPALAHAGAPNAIPNAIVQSINTRRPVMVDALLTEDGYKAMTEAAKTRGIRMTDLDSLDELKAERNRRPYKDVAEAIGAITKKSDRGPLTPADVETILDRTASSDISLEHKKAIYQVLDAELHEERTKLAGAQDQRQLNSARAETAIQQLDNQALEKLRGNSEIQEHIREMGILKDPDAFYQELQRRAAKDGVEATLAALESNPSQFGTTETLERGGWKGGVIEIRDGENLKNLPEVMENLKEYVSGIDLVKSNAESVQNLRQRQAELDAAVAEKESALAVVEARIKRETALLEPQTQREILRESLALILKSKEVDGNKLVQVGMGEAHAEERQAEVETGHAVQDRMNDVAHGANPDAIQATASSQAVLKGFSAISAVAVGRFYEAHPEQDPTGTMARAGQDARKPSPIDAEAHKLGDIITVDGLGLDDAAETPAKKGGRNIQTRSRRPKAESGMEHGL